MKNYASNLISLLRTIEGNGSFQTSGVKKFTPPGLSVEGVGEIGFPLNSIQIKALIRVAHKAPFGKGSRTITDPAVRSSWEIDARQLAFQGGDRGDFLGKILKKVKEGLGIEAQKVSASLYKMLIYEPGDFFLPHKDSEKEPGMFGTLVIGLPCAHTGGELVVRFDGRQEIIDFSLAASGGNIPFAAFFADCDHELKPVVSGYRVCLVYNLLQSPGAAKIASPKFGEQAEKLTALLKSMESSFENTPKAVLLGHQYTPANFSLENLKQHDRPRAEALLEAAEKAGYFAGLGLVTHYLSGELEGDFYEDDYYSYRRRGQRSEPEEATMGEVYETKTSINFWSGDGAPTLGDIRLDTDDLLTDLEVGEGDPIEKEQEGYTGNEGMTIEYWYHYGAVILWPKSRHFEMLLATPVAVRLKWLDYYVQHWQEASLQPQHHARQLVAGFSEEELTEKWSEDDFSPAAAALLKMKDENFLVEKCEPLLVAAFEKISVQAWLDLLKNYPPGIFSDIIELAATRGKRKVLDHLLEILTALTGEKSPVLKAFLSEQIQQLPEYLEKIELSELEKPDGYYRTETPSRKEKTIAIVEKTLALSAFKNEDAAWVKNALHGLARSLPRNYVNEVLTPILLRKKQETGALAAALRQVCLQDLTTRTAVKPTPPPDWRREVPTEKTNREIWDMLASFLESPTQKMFEYRKAEAYRSAMENAIRNVTIDLRTDTIRKGTPHTLVLTKTQAAYERALTAWQEDVALLEGLREG